ncbi:MAG: antibiotic biosynthesis monooxygenase [Enhydrobacter sp.]
MAKLAIVATIKTVTGKRDEYLKFLAAHGKRCLESEPGTLRFDIMLPQAEAEADTILLYEVYASPEAFDTHLNGASMKQIRNEATSLQVSLKGTRCTLIE